MLKRWMSALMAFAMVFQLCASPVAAFDLSLEVEEGITWSVSDGVLTISGSGPMEDYVYDESSWSYNTPWINYAYDITEVVIEDGVTSIGANAFGGMYSLAKIILGKDVASISEGVFSDCAYSLTTIEVSSENSSYCCVDDVLFNYDKTELIRYVDTTERTAYAVPATVKKIECSAFQGVNYLTSVTLQEGLQVIGDYAFRYVSISEISIPESVTEIGEEAFYGTSLTSVSIPNGVMTIGDCAFADLYNLTSVKIGSGVTSLGQGVFRYCSNLTELTVDEDNAAYCVVDGVLFNKDKTELLMYLSSNTRTSYEIPESVRTIDGYAFYSCSNLTSVSLPSGMETIGAYAFFGCAGLTALALPDGLKTIGDSAFYYCRSLAKADLPDGLTTLGRYAFSNTALTSVTIPNGVTTIGASAFSYAPLVEATIGSGVTEIETRAFSGCTRLETVTFLGDAPEVVGQYAFSSVKATCYYPQNNDTWSSEAIAMFDTGLTWEMISNEVASGSCGDNVTWSLTDLGTLTISGTGSMADGSVPWSGSGYAVKKVVVEEGVTRVGSSAFAYQDSLTEVYLADSVTEIGSNAFFCCQSLETVNFGANVNYIGDSAFTACTSLSKVMLFADMMYLGSSAFANCSGLEEIYLLGAVPSSYDAYAFSGVWATVYHLDSNWSWCYFENAELTWEELDDFGTCGEDLFWRLSGGGAILTIVGTGEMDDYASWTGNYAPWYSDYADQIVQLDVLDGVTSIGMDAFWCCEKLTWAFLADSVKLISMYAFRNCYALKEVTIPDGVTGIADRAFQNCYALEEITIPSGMTSVGYYVFQNCDALTSVTIPENITYLAWYAFASCDQLEEVKFLGAAPSIANTAFDGVTATCYYPADDESWTDAVFQNYGGTLTWVAAEDDSSGGDISGGDEGGSDSEQASGTIGDNLSWVLSADGVLTVSGEGEMTECPWQSIECTIRKVIVEDGVTSVGNSAFANCAELVEVVLADSVTTLEPYAFYCCSALETVHLGTGVGSFGSYAFCGCSSLERIAVFADVTNLGAYAFSNCDSLIEMYIFGLGPATYNPDAFGYVDMDTSVYYVSAVWGYYGFEAAMNWEQIAAGGACGDDLIWRLETDGTLAVVGTGPMYDYAWTDVECTTPWYDYDVSEIVLEEGITGIGAYAFYETDVTEVTIPAGVSSIGVSAFGECYTLTKVAFKEDAPSIGTNAFTSVEATCYYPAENASWTESVFQNYGGTLTWVADGIEFVVVDGVLVEYNGAGGDVVIPDEVTAIADSVFKDNASVTSVTFPEGLKSIGKYAFSGCTGLVGELNIPEGVTELPEGAFSGCSGVTSIAFGKGLESIYTAEDASHALYGMSCVSEVSFADMGADSNVCTMGNCQIEFGWGFEAEVEVSVGGEKQDVYADLYNTGETEAWVWLTILTPQMHDADGNAVDVFVWNTPGCFWYGHHTSATWIQKGIESGYLPADSTGVADDETWLVDEEDTGIAAGTVEIDGVTYDVNTILYNGSLNPEECTTLGVTTIYMLSSVTANEQGDLVCGDGTVLDWNLNADGTPVVYFAAHAVEDEDFEDVKSAYAAYQSASVVPSCTNADVSPFASMAKLSAVWVEDAVYDAYESVFCAKNKWLEESQLLPLGAVCDLTGLREDAVYSASIVAGWDEHPSGKADVYEIYVNGTLVGSTTECSYAVRDLLQEAPYGIEVRAVTEYGIELGSEWIYAQTVLPEVSDLWVDNDYNAVLPGNGTIVVQVKDSGNLKPLGDESMTAKLYYQTDENWTLIGEAKIDPETGRGTVAWDVTGMAAGYYCLLVVLADVDGASDEYYEWVSADGVVLPQVTGLKAESNVHRIALSWSVPEETRFSGYRVYRRVLGETKDAELVATNCGYYSNTWTDYSAEMSVTYEYYVSAFNSCGLEGNPSEYVSAGRAPDEEAPVVYYTVPDSGSAIAGKTLFHAAAQDNLSVTGMEMYLSLDNGDSWTLVAESDVSIVSTEVETTELSDGVIYIKTVAVDAAGNVSEALICSYTVDNTAPAVPGNLTVTAGQLKNTVSWSRSTEAGTTTLVYRALSEDGERTCVATLDEGDEVYNAWVDTDVEEGGTYYYWVAARDKLGNVSEAVGPVCGIPLSDTTPPVIYSIAPVNGSLLTGSVTFLVVATDNIQVKSIAMACSADGESWTDIDTVETDGSARFVVDTTGFEGEKLFIKITVLDLYNNQVEDCTTYSYSIDNTAPEQVTGLIADVTATTVTLNWNDVADQDFSHFVVEELVGDTYRQVGTVSDALGMHVYGLNPGTSHTYRVYAVDLCGNEGVPSESLTVTTVPDEVHPVIADISPDPAAYNGIIPMYFTVSDDHSVKTLTVEISVDGMNWQEIAEIGVERVGTYVTVSYNLDTTLLDEGLIYVRAIAVDLSGNEGDRSENAPYSQYVVDRTAPAVPTGFEAEAGGGKVVLSWEQGSEQDLNTYTLYRAESVEGEFVVIARDLTRLNWADNGLEYGKTYYYCLDVTDQAGNRSETTDVVACTVLQDDTLPQVVSVSPSDGYVLGSETAIQVKVWDNNKVKALYYQISTDGGQTWQDTVEVDVSAAEQVVKLTAIQENLSTEFQMVFWCVDVVDLKSESVYRTYGLDKEAPAAPDITAVFQEDAWAVELSWTGGTEEDLAGYRVYRAEADGSYRLLTQKTGGSGEYTYTDYSIGDGVAYSYYLESVDVRGNTAYGETASCVVPAMTEENDVVAPQAVLDGSNNGAVGYEIVFSAERSTDNLEIVSYLWDFGDGNTSTAVQVKHIYTKAGIYTVTLTVADAAGNTSVQTMTVTVRDPQAMGTLTVTVVDENGHIVPDAGVYVNLGSDDMSVVYTDYSGVAEVRVESGTHVIGVYKDGFLPNQKDADVVAGDSVELTISIIEREIVVGELTVERMTLEQIQAAGIDVTDPANQDVYEFSIQLTYGTYEYIMSGAYNGDGDVIIDPDPIEIVEEDEIRKLCVQVFPVIIGGGGTGGGGGIGGGGGGDVEVPMVVVIDIPGTASWLKDFFDVRLTVFNQADSQYVIDDCYAYLNVPGGLTLMDTNRTTSNPGVNMGSIAGQTSATAEWIIRGDAAGYYDLTADFSGVLRDFNAAINAQFKTAESFQVRQGDGLVLEVVVENAIIADTDGAVRVGLRNDNEYPYYLPNVQLDENLVDLVDNFKTNGRVVLEDADMEVLNTGETIWWDYIIPRENWYVLTERSGEDFYLLDAIVKSLGGTVELESEIQEVMPFSINGDLIVVTRLSDSGAESDISYVNIRKDSLSAASVPSLAIRTYRKNKVTQEYEPCSMAITIKDGYIIDTKDDVGEDGITVTTDANGYYRYDGYTINQWSNSKSYNIRISASRAKPVEIPVVVRGSSATTGLLTVYAYTGSGDDIEVLEGVNVAIMEADDTNATGTTDKDGKIVFKRVDQGYQELIITKDGYLPLRELVEVGEDTEYSFRMVEDDDPTATRILQVTNTLSDYTKGNQTVIPEGCVTGTVSFTLTKRIAEGETFQRYHYRIVAEDGTIREEDTFTTDSGFWLKLTDLKAGDTLEFAVENTDGKISSYMDSNLVVIDKPDFLNGLVYDMTKIQYGGSIDTSEAVEFDPFATIQSLFVSQIASGLVVEDDENGHKAALVEYLNQYVFSNTEVTQKFPLSAKYELSGKLTLSVICGGSAKTTTSSTTKYGVGGIVSGGGAVYGAAVEISQATEYERTNSGQIQLDFVFQYMPEKDDWSLTVYLSAGASQKLVDKDATFFYVLYVAGEVELKEEVKLELVQTKVGPGETTELLQNGLVPDSFKAEGEAKVSGGLTIVNRKLASVGVYAKAGLEFQFLPYWSLTAKAAVGAEGNVLIWKTEKDLVSGQWEASGDTSPAALAFRLLDNEETVLYLAERTGQNAGWQGNDGDEQWITDAYVDTDVQLATLNDGSVLAVWCDYTDNKADPLALYWSVCKDETWSNPARVDNDGTADLYPNLIETENGAQLVWVDFSGSVEDMTAMTQDEIREEAYAMLGVSTASYVDGMWSSAVEVSVGGLTAEPCVAAGSDGSVLVSWIANEDGMEQGLVSYPDSIGWALIGADGALEEQGSIVAPYAGISDLGLGYEYGYRMSVLAETEDGEVKALSSELVGTTWTDMDVVSGVSGEDTAMTVSENGVIYTINTGRLYASVNGKAHHLLHSDYLDESAGNLSCAETEAGTVLLWTCLIGSNRVICMSLVDDEWNATAPVLVESSANGVLADPVATECGAELMFTFQRSYVENDTWCRDVEIRTVPLGVDLSLEGGTIQHSSHLVPGLAMETFVTLSSLGVVTPDSFVAELYMVVDGEEEVLAENTGSASLNVTLQWEVPEDYAGETIYLRVVHDEDINLDNNVVQLENLVREMAVSGATYVGRMDGKDIFTVDVENQGLVPSEATVLHVRAIGSEDILLEQEVASLAAGAKCTYRLELDALDRSEDISLVFELAVANGEEDEANNKDYVMLSAIKIGDVSVTGTYTYNGTEQTATVVVQDTQGNVLTEGVDYKILSGQTGTNAGVYTVEISVLENGVDTGETASANWVIAKAPAVITVKDVSTCVDGSAPAFTYEASGLLNGDTLTTEPTLTCDVDTTQPGTYAIEGVGADSNGNYSFTYVAGTLTVLEHGWSANYQWTRKEDGWYCVATRTCSNDEQHNLSEEVLSTGAVKTAATCTEMGWTTYTAEFDAVWAAKQTKDVQDIAAKNHAWSVSYSWSEDGKSCIATHICGNDSAHNETAVATISSAVKAAATCTEKGWTTYTATFSESWATKQTKDVQDIAAKNHAWSVSYSWSENGKSCTATHICGNDSTHNETAVAVISSVVKTAATCTEKGWTTYTATFSESWATKQTKDVQDIAAKNHAWSVSYSWSEDGKSCTATHICGNDEVHNETAVATISSAVKTAATCTEKGWTTYTATFSESWATKQTKDVQDIAAKNHAWSVSYSWSENGKSCTATHICGNDSAHNETAVATISSAVKTAATCTEKGWTTYTAKFAVDWAAKQTKDVQDIAALGHSEVVDVAVAPTCTEAGLTEGKHCSLCGVVTEVQTVVPATDHNYEGGLCTRCNHDSVEVAVTDGVLTVSCEKMEEDTCVWLVSYDGSGRLVAVKQVNLGESVTLPAGERYMLIFVKENWIPVRKQLEL